MNPEQPSSKEGLTALYQRLAEGEIDRREFMRGAAALGAAGAAAATLGSLAVGTSTG